MEPILSMPANMANHCAEVLQGSYDIRGLELTAPVILDLGANLGSFSLWARHRFPDAVIHAYEPSPANLELLPLNVRDANIIIHPAAVSDYTGSGDLYRGKHNCGENSLVDVNAKGEGSDIVSVVDATTLPPADLIKLDIEGLEWTVISRYPHWDRVKACMLEWHRPEDRDLIQKFMGEQGFDYVESYKTQYTDRGMLKFAKGLPTEKGVPAHSVNLLIGMPCYGGLTHCTANRSLIELIEMLNRMQVRHDARYLPNESLIPRARNHFGTMCAFDRDANGDQYSHLLFLDQDIHFSARDIQSLVALDKDIAALPYSAKDFDWEKIVRAVRDKGITDPEFLRRIAGRPIINAHEKTSFSCNEAVQFPQLGTGLLLIKRRVFEIMAEKEPHRRYKLMNNEYRGNHERDFAYDYFQIGINPETRYYDSEDYRFCLDARKLGFETWLWPNAVTWHTGPYSFCMDISSQAALGIAIVGKEEDFKEAEAELQPTGD